MIKMNRVNAVVQNMRRLGMEQIIITDPNSVYYLTGVYFDTEERFLALYLNLNGSIRLFLNNMFYAPADIGIELVRFNDWDPYLKTFGDSLEHDKPLGVDKYMLVQHLLPLIDMKCVPGFFNASICVDLARSFKDAEERQAMRLISAINDQAMEQYFRLLREGITEQEVSNRMKEIVQSLGADDLSFPPSVCFGPNAAVGHYRSGRVALKKGDCVLIDTGCKKDGYCSDMTRTFFCGEPTVRQREIYSLVTDAVAAAERILVPGVRLCDIDKAARDVIDQGGFGEYFTTRLGHFIGLQVHDYGDVSAANQNLTQPGNIFSIEPGIYIPGEIGVRVEDLVMITENGCEILNHYSKNLQVIE